MHLSQMELKENKKRLESKRKLNPTSESRKGSIFRLKFTEQILSF